MLVISRPSAPNLITPETGIGCPTFSMWLHLIICCSVSLTHRIFLSLCFLLWRFSPFLKLYFIALPVMSSCRILLFDFLPPRHAFEVKDNNLFPLSKPQSIRSQLASSSRKRFFFLCYGLALPELSNKCFLVAKGSFGGVRITIEYQF